MANACSHVVLGAWLLGPSALQPLKRLMPFSMNMLADTPGMPCRHVPTTAQATSPSQEAVTGGACISLTAACIGLPEPGCVLNFGSVPASPKFAQGCCAAQPQLRTPAYPSLPQLPHSAMHDMGGRLHEACPILILQSLKQRTFTCDPAPTTFGAGFCWQLTAAARQVFRGAAEGPREGAQQAQLLGSFRQAPSRAHPGPCGTVQQGGGACQAASAVPCGQLRWRSCGQKSQQVSRVLELKRGACNELGAGTRTGCKLLCLQASEVCGQM